VQYACDRVPAAVDNLVLAPAPYTRLDQDVAFEDSLGLMRVLVLDFDALGPEKCNARLRAAENPCRFVVWYPWKYAPAETVLFHRELVHNGATLLEKESEHQSAQDCWARRKMELDEIRRKRKIRIAARLNRQAAGAA